MSNGTNIYAQRIVDHPEGVAPLKTPASNRYHPRTIYSRSVSLLPGMSISSRVHPPAKSVLTQHPYGSLRNALLLVVFYAIFNCHQYYQLAVFTYYLLMHLTTTKLSE